MNFFAPFRIALRALAANTLRSILTMLGIIIGVGAVITMIAVGGGAQARVEEQIRSLEMVAERIHEHGAGIKTCDCLGCQSSFPIRE